MTNPVDAKIAFTLLKSLVSFLSERRKQEKAQTLSDYLEWTRRQDARHQDESLQEIHKVLSENQALGNDLFLFIRDIHVQLGEVRAETSVLPDILKRVTDLQAAVTAGPSQEREHRLRVSLRLLENVASTPKGAGYGVKNLQLPPAAAAAGSAVLGVYFGAKVLRMRLLSLAGGLLDNRIDLDVLSDHSLLMRTMDAVGNVATVITSPLPPHQPMLVGITWENRLVRLYCNGRQQALSTMAQPFDRLGPVMFLGLDLDGEYSADELIKNYKAAGQDGMGLRRRGACDWVQTSVLSLHAIVLADSQLLKLWEVYLQDCNESKQDGPA